MFYYVYILISLKDSNFYIGYTTNLDERIKRHSNGEVSSTSNRRPLELVFYEAYLKRSDAIRREKYFKTTKGKSTLRVMLKDYLSEFQKNKTNLTFKKRKIIH